MNFTESNLQKCQDSRAGKGERDRFGGAMAFSNNEKTELSLTPLFLKSLRLTLFNHHFFKFYCD